MTSEIKVAVNGVLGRMGSTVLVAAANELGVIPVGGADISASANEIRIPNSDESGVLATSSK